MNYIELQIERYHHIPDIISIEKRISKYILVKMFNIKNGESYQKIQKEKKPKN